MGLLAGFVSDQLGVATSCEFLSLCSEIFFCPGSTSLFSRRGTRTPTISTAAGPDTVSIDHYHQEVESSSDRFAAAGSCDQRPKYGECAEILLHVECTVTFLESSSLSFRCLVTLQILSTPPRSWLSLQSMVLKDSQPTEVRYMCWKLRITWDVL